MVSEVIVQRRTQQLTLSAMFVALAVLFPMLFHTVGLGATFLPMFWPVAAAAFFLSAPLAVAVGILAPLLSFLTTGMPPISPPILHVIIVELLAMIGTIELLYHKTKLGLTWILLLGLIFSRIVLFFVVMVLAPLLGLPEKLFSAGMVIQGLPGVLAILIVVPITVSRIKREPIVEFR